MKINDVNLPRELLSAFKSYVDPKGASYRPDFEEKIRTLDPEFIPVRGRLVSWTIELIQQEALKYNTRGSFQIGSKNAYDAANRMQVLDAVCSHMELQRVSWTIELIQQEALKYNTRGSFKAGSGSAYESARAKKILNDVCNHMKPQLMSWTLESIQQEALKYNTRGSFCKNSADAYSAARRIEALDTVCSHMRVPQYIVKRAKKKIKCHQTNEVFEGPGQAASKLGLQVSNIYRVLDGDRNHTGGYTFDYVALDEACQHMVGSKT